MERVFSGLLLALLGCTSAHAGAQQDKFAWNVPPIIGLAHAGFHGGTPPPSFTNTNWALLSNGGGGNVTKLTINPVTGVRLAGGDGMVPSIWTTSSTACSSIQVSSPCWYPLVTPTSMSGNQFGQNGSSGTAPCFGFCPLNSTRNQQRQISSGTMDVASSASNSSVAYLYWNGWILVSTNIATTSPQNITWCVANSGINGNDGSFPQQTDLSNTGNGRYQSPFMDVDPVNPAHLIVGTIASGLFETFNGTSCAGNVSTVTWTQSYAGSIPASQAANGNIGYRVVFATGNNGTGTCPNGSGTCTSKVFLYTLAASNPGWYDTTNQGTTYTAISGGAASCNCGPSTVGYGKISWATNGQDDLWVTDSPSGYNISPNHLWRYSTASGECNGSAPCWDATISCNPTCKGIAIDVNSPASPSTESYAMSLQGFKQATAVLNGAAACTAVSGGVCTSGGPSPTALTPNVSVSSSSYNNSTGLVSVTTSAAFAFTTSDFVNVTGLTTGATCLAGPNAAINGIFQISNVNYATNTFTYNSGQTGLSLTLTASCGYIVGLVGTSNVPWQGKLYLSLAGAAASGAGDFDPLTSHLWLTAGAQGIWAQQFPLNSNGAVGAFNFNILSNGTTELNTSQIVSVGSGKFLASSADIDIGACQYSINPNGTTNTPTSCLTMAQYVGLSSSTNAVVPGTSFTVGKITNDEAGVNFDAVSTDGFATNFTPVSSWFQIINAFTNVNNNGSAQPRFTVNSTSGLNTWSAGGSSTGPATGSIVCPFQNYGDWQGDFGAGGQCYYANVIDGTHFDLPTASGGYTVGSIGAANVGSVLAYAIPTNPQYFYSNYSGGLTVLNVTADGSNRMQVHFPEPSALPTADRPLCLYNVTMLLTTNPNGCWMTVSPAPSATLTGVTYNAVTGVASGTLSANIGGGPGILIQIAGTNCTSANITVGGGPTVAQVTGYQNAYTGSGGTTITWKPNPVIGGTLTSPTSLTIADSACTVSFPASVSLLQSVFATSDAFTGGGTAYASIESGSMAVGAASNQNWAFVGSGSAASGNDAYISCTANGGTTFVPVLTGVDGSGNPTGVITLGTGATPVTATVTNGPISGGTATTAGPVAIAYTASANFTIAADANGRGTTILFVQLASGDILRLNHYTPSTTSAASSGTLYAQVSIPIGDSIANGAAIWELNGYSSYALVADPVTPNTFYVVNSANGGLYKWTNCVSGSGGAATLITADPNLSGFLKQTGGQFRMKAAPGQAGHLFLVENPLPSGGSQTADFPATNPLLRTCSASQSTATWQAYPMFSPGAFGFGAAKPGANYASEYEYAWFAQDGVITHSVLGVWLSTNDPNNGNTGTCKGGAPITGYIAGNVLTMSSISSSISATAPYGTLAIGDYITDCGGGPCATTSQLVAAGTQIDGMAGSGVACSPACTGTGSNVGGTYHVTVNQTVASSGSPLAMLASSQTWTNIGTAALGMSNAQMWNSNFQDITGDYYTYGPVAFVSSNGTYYAVVNYLLQRDIDPASNDNNPAFLEKVA